MQGSALREEIQLGEDKLSFADYVSVLIGWLTKNDWKLIFSTFAGGSSTLRCMKSTQRFEGDSWHLFGTLSA
jgi:hypothetical protein